MKKHLPLSAGVAALVLIATSGTTAVAASLVTGRQIKNNTVTSADIRDGSLAGRDVQDGTLSGADVGDGSVSGADLLDASVTGADLADGSITGADLTDGSITGADLTDGSITGADLAPGVIPAAPVLRAHTVGKTEEVPAGGVKIVAVSCPAGEFASGGGGNAQSNPGMTIIQAAPEPAFGSGAPTGWQVTYHNSTTSARISYGYAVCVKLG
jgi:hypothetical protein